MTRKLTRTERARQLGEGLAPRPENRVPTMVFQDGDILVGHRCWSCGATAMVASSYFRNRKGKGKADWLGDPARHEPGCIA